MVNGTSEQALELENRLRTELLANPDKTLMANVEQVEHEDVLDDSDF